MKTAYPDLDGKIALVTGASGGMGRAIAQALADCGAIVVASDIQEAAQSPWAAHDSVHYVQADVSSEASVRGLVQQALQYQSRLDVAVNAAAVEFELAKLADCDVEDFDRLMAVNLRGLFLCMKHELQAMAGNTGCAIVNLASTTSTHPGRLQPAYTASKFGVAGLTKQAAIDYASDGIRINAIAPGNIDTPMLQSAMARRGIDGDKVQGQMPLGRFGTAEEIAEAALWLCSQASSFTTGHLLAVEGGMLVG